MISNAKGFLSEIKAFPAVRYNTISTTDLLVYVVSQMEAHKVKLAFEPVVVGAFRFFPEKFALVGFPEYPDASRVGRTLLQCRPKYRGLIRGGASSGFVITELGRIRAAEVLRRLEGAEPSARPTRRARPRAIIDRIEQEVKDSAAFASWRAQEPISEYDFYHFLHLLPGSSKDSIQANFRTINDHAKDSQDSEIRSFLSALKAQFSKEL